MKHAHQFQLSSTNGPSAIHWKAIRQIKPVHKIPGICTLRNDRRIGSVTLHVVSQFSLKPNRHKTRCP